MQSPKNSYRPMHDILALAVVVLCALIVLTALIRPDAGFDSLLSMIVGAIVVVAKYYFGRRS